MKLEYHKGQNFGDALNPIIFNYFLPEFFDNNPSKVFLGIGSILGIKRFNPDQKIYVFSSGYAANAISTYGPVPKINNNYNFICVRGPLTARLLSLNEEKAITDGAILLAAMSWKPVSQKYEVSYMPHVGSLSFFDWESFCKRINIHFIDPRKDPNQIILDIRSSKKIITEAMHGAIVSDTFRIPWVPVKAYSTINEFKWKDWSASMNLSYIPVNLPSLFDPEKSLQILKNKFHYLPHPFIKILNLAFYLFQNLILKPKAILILKQINHFHLSDKSIFNIRLRQMIKKIDYIKNNL